MSTNKVTFTVEFDSEVWESMNKDQRSNWIDEVNDILSNEVYVSEVALKG